jgi:uncharacterized protein
MTSVDIHDRSTATFPAICGLAAALLFPLLPIGKWIASGESMAALLIREGVWWFYAVDVAAWLHFAERLPMDSIGLRRPTWKSLLFALPAAVALLAVFLIHFGVIVRAFHLDTSIALAERNQIMARPLWFRFLMVLRAAVVEEMVFRGYMIEKVRQLTGSRLLAIVFSVAAFTLAHLSRWGLVQLIPVFGAGVIFAALYVWKHDLPCNMIAHFITDGVGLLLG